MGIGGLKTLQNLKLGLMFYKKKKYIFCDLDQTKYIQLISSERELESLKLYRL
jgi:hypothetical protein